MRKRNKFELFGDILEAVEEEIATNRTARMTRVHLRSGIPYDRFKEYMREMEEKKFISITVTEDARKDIRLTGRGAQLLGEHRRVRGFLTGFGLLESGEDG